METDPLLSSFVKLLVSDVERSAGFYESLGFKRLRSEPPFLQLRWENQAELYLVKAPAAVSVEGRRGMGVLIGIRVGATGVEEVASRARALGGEVDGPTRQPWHTREVILADPDGYRLNFIEPA
jgi:lactoylglutathione lyase